MRKHQITTTTVRYDPGEAPEAVEVMTSGLNRVTVVPSMARHETGSYRIDVEGLKVLKDGSQSQYPFKGFVSAEYAPQWLKDDLEVGTDVEATPDWLR